MSDDTPTRQDRRREDPFHAQILREMQGLRQSQESLRVELKADTEKLYSAVNSMRTDMAHDKQAIDDSREMAKAFPVVKDRVEFHHKAILWLIATLGLALVGFIGEALYSAIQNSSH